MRIVIDVNIWLSFCIGHFLDDLPRLVALQDVELFTCLELNANMDKKIRFSAVTSIDAIARVEFCKF